MVGLRDHLARFRDTFISSDHSHMSVNDVDQFKVRGDRGYRKVHIDKNDQDKIQFIMDRQLDPTPHQKTRAYFIFVLACQAALTLRTITHGSEHMFKRLSEMHIGNL